jgi:hypothetical protein
MNSTILLISILGSVVLVAVSLLIVGGFLWRCDLSRRRARGAVARKLTRDPFALKDLLVGFFARSKGSARILRLLAARQRPVGTQVLIEDVRFDEQWRCDSDGLPASAIPVVLAIMQVAGLVRITRQGLAITELGREVHHRIEPSRRAARRPPPAARPISGHVRPSVVTLSSADRTAHRDLRKARTLLHR